MITHQQLVFAIQAMYPTLVHGVDYWVGQEMEGDTQIAEAKIYEWRSEIVAEPEHNELIELARQLLPEWLESVKPSVPHQCSGRQGQKALLRTPYGEDSNMLAAVKSLIASIPDDFMREDAELDFNAATWERNNQTLQALWAQLGGTESELDDLFRTAATL